MVMLGVSLAMDGSIESSLSAPSCFVSVWAPVHSPSSAAIKSHMSSFLSRSAQCADGSRIISSWDDADPPTHVAGFVGLLPVESSSPLGLRSQHGSCCKEEMRLPCCQD